MNDGTLTVQKVDPRADWLERRKNGIGGSDAAAALGLSPWKSPLALWSEKCGLVDSSVTESEAMEWGTILEGPVATKYARVTERILVDPGRHTIFTSADHPFMIGSIDREILPIDARGHGILEIKTANAAALQDWQDEVPVHYQVQLQHYLAILGRSWGSFAVLIGGQKFYWTDVPRNDRFISYLIEQEGAFWDRVVRGDPPPADASDSTKEVLSRLYPKDTGETKALPVEAAEWIERRRALKAEEKRISEELQEIDNQVKAALGDASLGILPDGSGFSWKSQHRESYTIPAADYRVLREIKPKGKR